MVDYYLMHDHIVFRVSDSLTFSNIDDFITRFQKAVREKGIYRTVIDASRIQVFDSTALSALVSQHRKLAESNGYLYLINANKILLDTLTATHLQGVLRPYASIDELLNSITAE
jgi:anti-anti-sigma factor